MKQELEKEFNRLVKLSEDPRGCSKDLVQGEINGITFALKLVNNNIVLGDVNLRTYSFDCWDMSGELTTKKVIATCEEHAILKFEKENGGEFGYDPPYVS